jgi:murein DD-endopeptidase MepM/ murein hydrolase activator NlpD
MRRSRLGVGLVTMWPDTVSPVATAAARAAAAQAAQAVPVAPPAEGFAALLDAQQRSPEALPTVTLGEMTGLIPTPQAMPVLATAGAVAPVAQAPATTTGQMAWPVQGSITSEFGPRAHPVTGAHRDHHGLDIAAATGTPIGAAADGKVTFAGSQGGYGNVVIVDHGNGTETRYAHQDTLAVTAGQIVKAGQRLGTVGSTGMSTGPHLHFEVRRQGEPVDPRPFLA